MPRRKESRHDPHESQEIPDRVPGRAIQGDHAQDHRLLRVKGTWTTQEGRPRARLVPGVPRLSEGREGVLRPAHADAVRPRPERALGHLAQLRLQRDHVVLWPELLVYLAGIDPGPGADLDGPERGGEDEDGGAAGAGRHLRVRPLRERAWRGPVFDLDGAQATR